MLLVSPIRAIASNIFGKLLASLQATTGGAESRHQGLRSKPGSFATLAAIRKQPSDCATSEGKRRYGGVTREGLAWCLRRNSRRSYSALPEHFSQRSAS